MIHLGDITKIDGKRIEPVDVIVGGSPCQDLSVAGKRAGLAGERSGLFMEQIRLTKELRQQDAERGKPAHLCRPRYFVWENVPGAFSSKKGEDFAAVLEEVIRVIEPKAPSVSVPEKGWPTAGCIYDEMGRWSVAWRVHDAQFWGVPQRRRRIALVADFGGLSAPEVLFERKGLRWDTAQSGKTRQGATADAERGFGGAISFQERGGKPGGGKGILIQNERTGALSTLNNQSVFNIGSYHSNAWKSDNPHSSVYETEVSKTLDALNCGYPACNQGGTAIVAIHQNASGELKTSTKGYTIGTSSNASARNTPMIFDARGNGDGETVCTITGDHENRVTDYTALLTMQGFGDYKETGVTSACKSRDYKDATDLVVSGIDARNGEEVYAIDHAITTGGNCTAQGPCIYKNIEATLKAGGVHAVSYESVDGTTCIKKHVRRLTPLECERMQGYPDGWTDIGEWIDSKGKRHDSSDSARYKALGNSIALPFWHWLMRRISAQYVGNPTLGSLFDGISGFCLSWARCNGAKNCRWSSEIEEFPMAVTRKHFGDEKTGEVGDIEKYL